jgi:hypothetical protein
MTVQFNPPTLWDAHQIGAYLRVTRKTVLTDYVHKPGFPQPVGGARRNRLWVAEDVVKFLTRRAAA